MLLLLQTYQSAFSDDARHTIRQLAVASDKACKELEEEPADIADYCEENGVDILFISVPNERKKILHQLKRCRQLRIPYVLLTPQSRCTSFKNLLVTVGFLEEELAKAHYATWIGRSVQGTITLLQANDYGSRAQQNCNKIESLIQKLNLPYQIKKGKRDSFSIDREATALSNTLNAELLVISASREYGLDDTLFGPAELYVIKKSTIPVMVINPRKDLYTLCD